MDIRSRLSVYEFTKFITYSLIATTLIVAFLAFHYYSTVVVIKTFGFYAKFLAIGFPLLFYIKDKSIRWVCITIVGLAMFLKLSFVCLLSIFLTLIVRYWKYRYYLLIIFILTGPFITDVYSNSITQKFTIRYHFYKQMFKTWTNPLYGEGAGAFLKLNLKYKLDKGQIKPVKAAHSDLLQGIYEMGIIKMIPIIIIMFLPLLFISVNYWWVVYINLIAQYLTDFPFQRPLTSLYCYIVLIYVYLLILYRKRLNYCFK